jgi:hypothetical protein
MVAETKARARSSAQKVTFRVQFAVSLKPVSKGSLSVQRCGKTISPEPARHSKNVQKCPAFSSSSRTPLLF